MATINLDYRQSGYGDYTLAYGRYGPSDVYNFFAGTSGDELNIIGPPNNGASVPGWGLNFYDNGGGNIINLAASQISSNLYMGGDEGGSMNFISRVPYGSSAATYRAAAHTAGGDVVELNPIGTGNMNMYLSDVSGFLWIKGFDFGHDSIDMLLSVPGEYALTTLHTGNGTEATIVSGAHQAAGFILEGMSPFAASTHVTVTGDNLTFK